MDDNSEHRAFPALSGLAFYSAERTRSRGWTATESKGVRTVRHFRRSHDDSGAAAVEFALLLPLFILLVFGIISGGVFFNDKLSLNQGVREAARYGATLNNPPTDVPSATAFLTTILNSAQGNNYGQIGTSATTFCIGFIPANSDTTKPPTSNYYLTYGASTATTTPCDSGDPSTPGSVFVIGKKPSNFNLMITNLSTTLVSVAVARYEGIS
jgi:Flp pilus assembly protein TadG